MEKQYEIRYQGNPCGIANISRQGLFLIIQCCCSLESTEPLKIILRSADRMIDLGWCMKQPYGYGLQKRISIKELPAEPIEFSLEAECRESFDIVAENTPFPLIDRLYTGKFAIQGGIPGIVLPDQIVSSRPTGQ